MGVSGTIGMFAYVFFPNEHSREQPFILMFGCAPLVSLNTFLKSQVRYLTQIKCLILGSPKEYI